MTLKIFKNGIFELKVENWILEILGHSSFEQHLQPGVGLENAAKWFRIGGLEKAVKFF